MNIETREIRDERELSEAERRSHLWIPVRRKYAQKQPVSDADFKRILAAEERRLSRQQRRLRALRSATP